MYEMMFSTDAKLKSEYGFTDSSVAEAWSKMTGCHHSNVLTGAYAANALEVSVLASLP